MGKINFKYSNLWIIILLILTGTFVYIRSINRNLISDEIIYCYVFGEKQGFYCYAEAKEIKTISDILESQMNHYNVVNGRTLVHTIEQFFSGIVGVDLFYALNAIVFVFTIILFVKMMFDKMDKYKYWIFTIVAFLYLFPEPSNLWISINFSLNYLWPLCICLLLLYYWKKLRLGIHISKVQLSMLPFIGFVAGWSHEAFVVPISAVIFIYYCFNYKEFSSKIALLIIPFVVGAMLLLFAPGNFIRLQNETYSSYILGCLKENPFVIKLLPLFIILVLFFWRKRVIEIRQFVRNNGIWIGLFIVSLLFVLALGLPMGRAYTAVELFSLILIVKLLQTAQLKVIMRYSRQISVTVTICYVVHQSFICAASIKENKLQDNLINQYIESNDGVAVYDYRDYGYLINPFIRRFKIEIGDNPAYKFSKETIELRYTKMQKRLIPVSSMDFELISNYGKYLSEKEGLKYSGPFYTLEGCDYAWALVNSVNEADKFEFNYAPVSFADDVLPQVKLKRLLLPNKYSTKSRVGEISKVSFNSCEFFAIRLTPNRNVVDIKRIE